MVDHDGELPLFGTRMEAHDLVDADRVGDTQYSMATLAETTLACVRVLTS
jgi:hypothetical protein